VVESLEKRAQIEAVERIRDGRRPERTVYALTPAGDELLHSWLSELLATPSPQFTDFEAAMSLLPALTPEVVTGLLRQRAAALEAESAEWEQMRTENPDFPRVFSVESEYRAALRTAELTFVRELVSDIAAGTFSGLPIWRRFHELKKVGRAADLGAELADQFGAPDTQEP
jgi:DNA-binding PadR family transcriptional regulator